MILTGREYMVYGDIFIIINMCIVMGIDSLC